MCFKIKFAANPFKCLIDRPCNRPTRDFHTICNFLMGLVKNIILVDQVTLLFRQNRHHCMKCFLLNKSIQNIDFRVYHLAPIFRYGMVRNTHFGLTHALALLL